jgi:hypothetical protein
VANLVRICGDLAALIEKLPCVAKGKQEIHSPGGER